MRALHFGAGNIGRGFIGKVLYEAGADVVFADVVPTLIDELKRRKEFPVRVVGASEHVDLVKIEDAVFSNQKDILTEIQKADLITTAVGPRILVRVADTLAKGLHLRRTQGVVGPVNVIACENAIRATETLKKHVFELVKEEEDLKFIKQNVGWVNSAVDRIVPPAPPGNDPLEVTVEDFCEWVVDETQFVGQSLPQLPGLVFTDNLNAFVERKLMTVNTGHAICAYVGKLYGHEEIREAIQNPKVKEIVQGAMRESGAVLVRRYSMDPVKHEAYIQKILGRFANPYLKDSVTRVGREPIRKLDPNDRLIRPLLGCIEYGLPHEYLVKGIAAALVYEDPEDEQAVRLQATVKKDGLAGALEQYSKIPASAVESGEIRSAVDNYGTRMQLNI